MNPNNDVNTNLMLFYKSFEAEKLAAEKRHLALVEEVRKKIDLLVKENKRLLKENRILSKTVVNLSDDVNDVKQLMLEKNLIVNGIPEFETTPNDTAALITTIFTGLGVEVNESNIEEVARLGKKPNDTVAKRSILVKLNSASIKHKIIKAKREWTRKSPLNCATLTYNGKEIGSASDNIYINQDLTHHNANLYREARRLKKNGSVEYAWISQLGSVLVREKEGLPAQRIRNEAQLKMFYKFDADMEVEETEDENGTDIGRSTEPTESFAGRRVRKQKGTGNAH